MGLFESMRRIFMGEPVFKNGDQQSHNQQHGQAPQAHGGPMPLPTQSGHVPDMAERVGTKSLPQVMIERWQCDPAGAGLHVELRIRNYSNGPVTLQRIEVMGIRDELGNTVNAGEHYEFLFNLPNRLKDMNLDECRLYFRNEAGDYFMALHQVEYDKLPDGTYSVKRFRLLPPIRDV